MAMSKTTSTFIVTGANPAQVVAANTARTEFKFRIHSGEGWFGPDSSVVADDGWLWTAGDGIYCDETSLDAWYVTTRAGTKVIGSYVEVTN